MNWNTPPAKSQMIDRTTLFGFPFKAKTSSQESKGNTTERSSSFSFYYWKIYFSFPSLRIVKKKAEPLKSYGPLRVFDTYGE